MSSATSSFGRRWLSTMAVFTTVVLLAGLRSCSTAPTSAVPDMCRTSRPRSEHDCSDGERVRRFFFKADEDRCKPFGICPQDAEFYDRQIETGTPFNYFVFLTMCQEICMQTVEPECPLPTVDNGEITIQGSEIHYSCNEGYALVGPAVRTCLRSMSWSGEETICKELVQCPPPGMPANGESTPTDTTEGSEVTYSCNVGFNLVGSATRTCLSDGTWSGTEPTCEAVQCPQPQAIANGSFSGNDTSYGTEITYSCDVGFQMRGSRILVCEANGTWSEEEPACEVEPLCPPPPRVANASELDLPLSDGYSPGTSFTYTCKVGFQLAAGANPQIICKDSGTWSQPPHCEANSVCPKPGVLANGNAYAPCWEPDCEAVYECNPGYILIGAPVRRCKSDGQWDTEAPTCAKVELLHKGTCVSNTELYLVEESNVDIQCRINPVGILLDVPVWSLFNGKPMPHGVGRIDTRLRIPNVNAETAQNYTCTIGDLKAFVDIKVQVNQTGDHNPPEPVMPMSVFPPSPILPGQDVALGCLFRGCPTPNVTWERNGQILVEDERITFNKVYIPEQVGHVTTVYSSVTIREAITEDSGEYKCIGRNGYGPDGMSTTSLQVIDSRTRRDIEDPELRQRRSENRLCSELDPDTVTLVAKVRRSPKRHNGVTSLRVEVAKVLRAPAEHAWPLDNSKLIKALLGQTHDSTRLKKDTTHILTGRVTDSRLHLSSDSISILPHSAALEDAIATCQ